MPEGMVARDTKRPRAYCPYLEASEELPCLWQDKACTDCGIWKAYMERKHGYTKQSLGDK